MCVPLWSGGTWSNWMFYQQSMLLALLPNRLSAQYKSWKTINNNKINNNKSSYKKRLLSYKLALDNHNQGSNIGKNRFQRWRQRWYMILSRCKEQKCIFSQLWLTDAGNCHAADDREVFPCDTFCLRWWVIRKTNNIISQKIVWIVDYLNIQKSPW